MNEENLRHRFGMTIKKRGKPASLSVFLQKTHYFVEIALCLPDAVTHAPIPKADGSFHVVARIVNRLYQ